MKQNAGNDAAQSLTRRLLDEGGVTLQRFSWTAAPGNPFDRDERLLALSLELLLEFYTPGRLESLLDEFWPEDVRPFVVVGETVINGPQFALETHRRLLSLNKTSAVDLRLSSLRLHPDEISGLEPRSGGACDTVQICSGLVVGCKQVSLGIAYQNADDLDSELSVRLRWMARQVLHDQLALPQFVSRDRRLPDMARALVNTTTGEIVWRNALARVGWPEKGRFIEALIKTKAQSQQERHDSQLELALITFLRSGRDVRIRDNTGPLVEGIVSPVREVLSATAVARTSLPEPVKRRLKSVVFPASGESAPKSQPDTTE